jgi:hypothetical protein
MSVAGGGPRRSVQAMIMTGDSPPTPPAGSFPTPTSQIGGHHLAPLTA